MSAQRLKRAYGLGHQLLCVATMKCAFQVIQVLGGELSQYMSKPDETFRDELQAVGKAISLVTAAQVSIPCHALHSSVF